MSWNAAWPQLGSVLGRYQVVLLLWRAKTSSGVGKGVDDKCINLDPKCHGLSWFRLLINMTWVTVLELLCRILPRVYVSFYTKVVVTDFLVHVL